jgi:DNA-binding SARP family transcriptional activator
VCFTCRHPSVAIFRRSNRVERHPGWDQQVRSPGTASFSAPVLICLLGAFQILKNGSPLALRPGGKVERLVGALALEPTHGVARDELLERVWPGGDPALAAQSLNSLAHWLNRHLRDALAGSTPIVHGGGRYALNTDGGLRVDVVEFEAALEAAEVLGTDGRIGAAIDSYRTALTLYTGDLGGGSDVAHLLERERLRARFLTALSRLADHYFFVGDYARSLASALELLHTDPCREDAHRVAMRCYVRTGARAQALRQYRVCETVLALEFDAAPEPATEALYELVRADPHKV